MSEVSTSKPKRAKSTKAKETVSISGQLPPPSVGKADIGSAAITAWAKLDAVINTELNAVAEGSKELNASIVTAIVKHIEASISISRSNEDISPKDTADRVAKLYSNLPVFNDEGDGYDNNNSKGG